MPISTKAPNEVVRRVGMEWSGVEKEKMNWCCASFRSQAGDEEHGRH